MLLSSSPALKITQTFLTRRVHQTLFSFLTKSINNSTNNLSGLSITKDEYGTAAYKTCELDSFMDDAAVQHREVQNHESALFKDYFEKIE